MSTARRLPRWSELRPLLRLRTPIWHPTRRRLARALTIDDLRTSARRITPRAVFDYVDGAADAEIGLGRARAVFRDLEFQPEILRDVSHLTTTAALLGVEAGLPLVLAPTGFTRMMHHTGEIAVARAGARWNIPYALSTLGTTSIEDLAAQAPTSRRWFQLYVWRDRGIAQELMRRAAASGYEALILTVDVPVSGVRLRDLRSGFSLPPQLTVRNVANTTRHPGWWMNFFTTAPPTLASFSGTTSEIGRVVSDLFDPSMTDADLAWIREHWSGPLIVKGIQTVADAVRVIALGADAVVVSNHGGRQLDRGPVPLRLVPDVRDRVGDAAELYVDTGVLSGADVAAALALGASGVLIGRAYLYGLMAGGEAGVDRAVAILAGELERTMKLLGVTRVSELSDHHVRLP